MKIVTKSLQISLTDRFAELMNRAFIFRDFVFHKFAFCNLHSKRALNTTAECENRAGDDQRDIHDQEQRAEEK